MAKNGKQPAAPSDATLLGMIPQAVDEVCAETAIGIEATAKRLIENAHEVAAKLNELALAIREHGRIAETHVAKFCSNAKHVMETAAQLQAQLRGELEIAGRLQAEVLEVTAGLPETQLLPDAIPS